MASPASSATVLAAWAGAATRSASDTTARATARDIRATLTACSADAQRVLAFLVARGPLRTYSYEVGALARGVVRERHALGLLGADAARVRHPVDEVVDGDGGRAEDLQRRVAEARDYGDLGHAAGGDHDPVDVHRVLLLVQRRLQARGRAVHPHEVVVGLERVGRRELLDGHRQRLADVEHAEPGQRVPARALGAVG